MMRVPGRKLARRALRPVAKVLFPGAAVLGYHRIAKAGWDPLELAVSPDHFTMQLEVLKEVREVVSLSDLAAAHGNGEPLDRYASLTFDDGYRDFALTALPILEAYGLPATVFVATGFTGRGFWWDDVAALLAPEVPAAATLEMAGNGTGSRRYTDLHRLERRGSAVRDICNRLVGKSAAEIQAAHEQLQAWAGPDCVLQLDGAAMTQAQLRALAQHPLVELGAHTVSHGCLAHMTPEAQRTEIEQSKAALESLPAVVSVFSYPNGSYSKITPNVVEELGFTCACTSTEATFGSRSDRYRMPRLWASDSGAPEFRRWLGQWVDRAA